MYVYEEWRKEEKKKKIGVRHFNACNESSWWEGKRKLVNYHIWSISLVNIPENNIYFLKI